MKGPPNNKAGGRFTFLKGDNDYLRTMRCGVLNLFFASLVGLIVTGLLVVITEYYTSGKFKPVKSIAEASVSGHGTNIIQGLAVSMKSTAWPVITITAGILASYHYVEFITTIQLFFRNINSLPVCGSNSSFFLFRRAVSLYIYSPAS